MKRSREEEKREPKILSKKALRTSHQQVVSLIKFQFNNLLLPYCREHDEHLATLTREYKEAKLKLKEKLVNDCKPLFLLEKEAKLHADTIYKEAERARQEAEKQQACLSSRRSRFNIFHVYTKLIPFSLYLKTQVPSEIVPIIQSFYCYSICTLRRTIIYSPRDPMYSKCDCYELDSPNDHLNHETFQCSGCNKWFKTDRPYCTVYCCCCRSSGAVVTTNTTMVMNERSWCSLM